jgi:hydrogenase nickel incorporation protein HypA/HybF
MHELSIAMSLLDVAAEEAERLGAAKVTAIRLQLGPLSGVVKEALLSAFEEARKDSEFGDCTLMIEDMPIVAHCVTCNAACPVVSIQEMRCSVCRTPVDELIGGRELEVVGLEIIDGPTSAS